MSNSEITSFGRTVTINFTMIQLLKKHFFILSTIKTYKRLKNSQSPSGQKFFSLKRHVEGKEDAW